MEVLTVASPLAVNNGVAQRWSRPSSLQSGVSEMTRAIRLMLVAVVLLAIPVVSFGAVFVSVSIAPPILPVYSQPICPGQGYIWTPGYWAYGAYGYYWVPGAWVLAPFTGALWTPGYWGWGDGVYLWHEGYWGLSVGFYGGINYGFGYTGFGYYGGYWNHGAFYYNGAVSHVDRAIIHNVYSRAVTSSGGVNRVSFNGGRGGTSARPTAAQLAATRGRHDPPTAAQSQLRTTASTNRAQLATVSHGRPAVMATTRPEAFTARGTAPANRESRNATSARQTTRPTARPTTRQTISSAHANAPSRSHVTTRAHAQTLHAVPAQAHHSSPSPAPHYRASTQHAVAPHSSSQVRRTTAAPRNRAPVQHVATRSAGQSRHANQYSARNNPAPRAVAPHTVQPHESAPRPQSAPRPAGHENQARREGGHG